MRWKRAGVAFTVVVVCLVVLARVSDLVVNWAWFSSVGFVGVFWTVFVTKIILFIVVFAISSLLLWLNGALALRFAWWRRFRLSAALDPGLGNVPALPGSPAVLFGVASPLLPWGLLVLAVALVVGALVAIEETGQWDLILRFLYQVPYGQTDPLFGKDIGFYLFSLPVYIAVKNWMLLILALSSAMAGAVYFLHGDIDPDHWPWRISSAAIAHGSALLGLWFAVKAWSYVLDRYLLLYDDNGVVVGAGYTDSPCRAAGSLAARRVLRRRRRRRMDQCAAAHLPAGDRGVGAGVRRLVRARRGGPRAVRALLCQAERTAIGSAVHPSGTSRSRGRRTTCGISS